ncbi:type I methionyl aminopeptidase [Paraferrimonas haliotis]|uniref:Methionine aminopeptidase n=1 Tax=Paraferrimonas haliotis TaxID=2013866 RepID=A0AA37WW09_9GAMM|nr:type I methionyl aminopeptidase [Paraferrimonas haliotis]GLS82727.1 methionine aminopeptidase [Paraferrimonas haliotis]
MSIVIKTEQEIEQMRIAGRLAADVLEMIEPHVKAGVTTGELDRLCHDYIVEQQQCYPAPLNYHGFPKSICTSVNQVICHGIPSDEHVLKDGDIINIDITVITTAELKRDEQGQLIRPTDGFHGDTSKMFLVGDVSPENKRLCRVTQESLYAAMRKVKPGVALGELGSTIQKYIKKSGRYSIVKDFCGHGIGREFHEEPQIVHYKNGDRTKLQEGMCFTIEPMINLGRFQVVVDEDDGWTAETIDGKNSAQWEHTIVVTKDGCEVLTLRQDDTIPRFMNNG